MVTGPNISKDDSTFIFRVKHFMRYKHSSAWTCDCEDEGSKVLQNVNSNHEQLNVTAKKLGSSARLL